MQKVPGKVFTRRHWAFAMLGLAVVVADFVLLSWFLPGATARLAVRQLEPDDTIAAEVRTAERTKNLFVTISGAVFLVAVAGLADLPLRWRDSRRVAPRASGETDPIEVEVIQGKEDR